MSSRRTRSRRSSQDVNPETRRIQRRREDHVDELIQSPEMRDCFDIVAYLMDLPQAPPFNEPVDYVKLKIPDYPKIIKNPMDLGTIKENLLSGTIDTPEYFAEHCRLVFNNAKTYNQAGSAIYVAAETLLAEFEFQFARMQERHKAGIYNAPLAVEGVGTGTYQRNNENDFGAMREEMRQLQQTLQEVKSLLESNQAALKAANNPPKRIRLTKPRKPLTYQEKELLCRKITSLTPELLLGLLDVMNSGNTNPAEEVEIDIDKLDDMTLLRVQAYVDECFAKHNLELPPEEPAAAQ